MSKELKVVGAKLPPSLYEKVEEEVSTSNYINVSDFLRQSVRDRLSRSETNLQTITINKNTHNKLMEIGKQGEDFDDVLQKLIKERNGGGGDY